MQNNVCMSNDVYLHFVLSLRASGKIVHKLLFCSVDAFFFFLLSVLLYHGTIVSFHVKIIMEAEGDLDKRGFCGFLGKSPTGAGWQEWTMKKG